MTYWPNKSDFPEALIQEVYGDKLKNEWATYRGNNYYFIGQDLNADSELDYIVIEENNYSTSATLWFLEDNQWQPQYMQTSNPNDSKFIKDFLLNNDVEVSQPKWQNLKIGDLIFRSALD